MTPEGKTKARINKVLEAHGVYFEMYVPVGYGRTFLDYTCARPIEMEDGSRLWESFWIEAKAHRKDPSDRQAILIDEHRKAGRVVFVIDDQDDRLIPKHDTLAQLDKWLRS